MCIKMEEGTFEDILSIEEIERLYLALKTDLRHLNEESFEFQMICSYAYRSNRLGNLNFKVLEIFSAERKGEKEKFQNFCGNVKATEESVFLLWYGQRLCSMSAILSNGIRNRIDISSGAIFQSITFQDTIASSLDSTHMLDIIEKSKSPKDHKLLGTILLCEVALGKVLKIRDPKEKLPETIGSRNGENSIMLQGKHSPDENELTKIAGCMVPLGEINVVPNHYGQYNQYIVNDPNRVHIKYLLKVECTKKFPVMKKNSIESFLLSSLKVQWRFRTSYGWTDYNTHLNTEIENAHKKMIASIQLTIHGTEYIVDLTNLVQYVKDFPDRRRAIQRKIK